MLLLDAPAVAAPSRPSRSTGPAPVPGGLPYPFDAPAWWHVAQVVPGREMSFVCEMARRDVRAYVPMHVEIRHYKRNEPGRVAMQEKAVPVPLISCYGFYAHDQGEADGGYGEYCRVKDSKHVVDILPESPQQELVGFLLAVAMSINENPRFGLVRRPRIGQRVRFREFHPLRGTVGTLIEDDGRQTVVIECPGLMGCAVPVETDLDCVEVLD